MPHGHSIKIMRAANIWKISNSYSAYCWAIALYIPDIESETYIHIAMRRGLTYEKRYVCTSWHHAHKKYAFSYFVYDLTTDLSVVAAAAARVQCKLHKYIYREREKKDLLPVNIPDNRFIYYRCPCFMTIMKRKKNFFTSTYILS
jgi:hypothetical protein